MKNITELLMDSYDVKHSDRYVPEVDFLEYVGGFSRGQKLLDLGCGTGGHAIEFARRGYNVVGVDTSPAQLAQAKVNAETMNVSHLVRFEKCGIQEMQFEREFDGAYCMLSPFGFMESSRVVMSALASIHQSIKAGAFVVDAANAYKISLSHCYEYEREISSSMKIECSGDYNYRTASLRERLTLRGGNYEILSEQTQDLRIYFPHEIIDMLEEQGFTVEGTYGDYEGHPYTRLSPRFAVMAKKLL